MKEYIVESLFLLMSKKAYTDITIGEITDKAGVNRSTYYHNFATKEKIVALYLSSILHEWLERYGQSADRSQEQYIPYMNVFTIGKMRFYLFTKTVYHIYFYV